ncbi:peptidoglycan-binding protein [Streptomyces sp. NPDC059009]|uniref:peptidoglycan-binding domain-containing protein n=1 Tax=Streptomyces sp. NPDC059009 TaxID=3346694 RepID=UPI003687F1CB
MRTSTRLTTMAAAVAVSALALTACGSDSNDGGDHPKGAAHTNSASAKAGSNLTTMGKTTPNIGPGSTNELGVRCVQIAVNVWATNSGQSSEEPLEVDSKYGQQTYTWVKKFQKAKHLSVDGIVGPRTGDQIYGVLSANPGTARACYPAIPVTRDM